MPALDRFSNRFYYETHFMEEGLPLWIWETGDSSPYTTYYYYTAYKRRYDPIRETWYTVEVTKVRTYQNTSYSNSLFRPADWFTMDSTPNYFVVDIYGISAGGYASHHKHRSKRLFHGDKISHYNASGGSGSTLYLVNVKIRIKDEDLKPIVYQMYGKAGPQNPYGKANDWHVDPRDVHNDVNDWCMRLAEPARTPTGIAPEGHFIMGMAAGGNAYEASHKSYPGHGADRFYIPTQCAFPADIADLRTYQNGEDYITGEWINHDNVCYRVDSPFRATNWSTDSNVCSKAPTYSDNVTYGATTYLYYNNGLYYVRTQFSNDPGNTILGWADYLLDKSIKTMDVRWNGNSGVGPYKGTNNVAPETPPNRFFDEGDVTSINEIWVGKSLSWGQGQRCQGAGTLGQGGGMAMIYKGESS